MSIIIKREDHDVVYVNEKRVQMDSNGNWVAPYDELTPSETKAFYQHLNAEKMSINHRLN